MPSIGETLREARIRQGIDISGLEHQTKIRARYLRALENEEFEQLPGSTYVRSFLRTYAEQLGLDGQLLVEEYRLQHEPEPEPDTQPFSPQPRIRDRYYGRRGPGLGFGIGVAIAALLALLLVLGLTGDTDDEEADERGDRSAQREERRGRREPGRSRRPGAAPQGVALRIVPLETTYLCVDDGAGRILYEGTVSEPRTFRGRRLRVNLGRTSAELTVNGRRVPLGEGAQPVGFAFTPRGRRPLPEAERPCA